VAHGDYIADDVPLAEGLHHPDQGQEDSYPTPNQADLNSMLPEAKTLLHFLTSLRVPGKPEIPLSKHPLTNFKP